MNAATHQLTGELRWNIKQSLRDYLAEVPDGQETWTGSTGGLHGGDLVFPAATVTPDPDQPQDSYVLHFTGAVRYAGHHGMLRVDIADPQLEVAASQPTRLTVNIAPPGVPERRIALATVDGHPTRPDDATWHWDTEATTLTASGATALGSVYPPGTHADGFTLHASRTP